MFKISAFNIKETASFVAFKFFFSMDVICSQRRNGKDESESGQR